MSTRVLRFYFDYISPYSYLAWHRLPGFARQHDLRVEPVPILLAAVLDHLDHKGPGEIPPKRAYVFKDCLRGAALHNVAFRPPFSHPFNPLPALRVTLLDMDDDVRLALISRLFAATWAEGRDVGSADVVGSICAEVGVPQAPERIRSAAIKQRLKDTTTEALGLGAFGVPTMIVDGELFWGTDSFAHLERYLAGKDPARDEDMDAWYAVRASATRKSPR